MSITTVIRFTQAQQITDAPGSQKADEAKPPAGGMRESENMASRPLQPNFKGVAMNAPDGQEYSFAKLIGQGVKVVYVWYNFDDDVNMVCDMTVTTDSGVEIDQYLTEDTLADLDMECYSDLEKQRQMARENYALDRGEDLWNDRMAA